MPNSQGRRPMQFRCTGGCNRGSYVGPLQDVIKHMKSKKLGHSSEPLTNLFIVPFNREGGRNLRVCVHPGCEEVVNGDVGQANHSRLKHGGVRILNRTRIGLQPTPDPNRRQLPNENHYNDDRENDDLLYENVFGYTPEDDSAPRFQYTVDSTQSSNLSTNNNSHTDTNTSSNQATRDNEEASNNRDDENAEEIFNGGNTTADNNNQTQNEEAQEGAEANVWNDRLRHRENRTQNNRQDNSDDDADDDDDDADESDDETYTPPNATDSDDMSEVNTADVNSHNNNANTDTARNTAPPVNFNAEANDRTQSEEDKPFNYFRDIPLFAFRDLKEDIVTEIQSLKIKTESDFLDYYLGVRHLRLDRVWGGYNPIVKSLSSKLIAYYLNSTHLTRLFGRMNTDSMEVEDEDADDAIITAINNNNGEGVSNDNVTDNNGADDNNNNNNNDDDNDDNGENANNNPNNTDNGEDNAAEEINREVNVVPHSCYATSKILALTAWLILPTLFRMLYKSKNELPDGNLQRYLKELDDITKPEYLAGMVITLFQKGRPHLIVEEPTNTTISPGQKVKARIFDLIINKGHLSRGMQLIKRAYGTDITPEEGQISPEEFEEEVAKLHPKRIEEYDDISELTHITEIPSLTSLTSTPSNLHKTIGSLKKDSTPGWDGWTFDLIRQLYFEYDVDDENPSEDTALLLELMHRGLRGECEGKQLWNASKILLLVEKKSDGRIKKRPIAIPGGWTRLMSKVALSLVGDETGDRLAPIQLAVGIPDGISIGAKLLQHMYEDPEMTILSIDFSNAFNSVRGWY